MLATSENFNQLPTYLSEQAYGAFVATHTIAIAYDVDKLETVRNEIFDKFGVKAPIIPLSRPRDKSGKLADWADWLDELEKSRTEIIQNAPSVPLRRTTLVYYDKESGKPLTADRGGRSSYIDSHSLTMPTMGRPTPLSPTSIIATTEGAKRSLLEIGIDIHAERLVYDFVENILFPQKKTSSYWSVRRKRDKLQDEKRAYLDKVEARHGDAITLEKAEAVDYKPPRQHTPAEEEAYRRLLEDRKPAEKLEQRLEAEEKAKEDAEKLRKLARARRPFDT